MAAGLFPVVEAKNDTLVIEPDDGMHERISRDRVVLAPLVVDHSPPDVVQGDDISQPREGSRSLAIATQARGLAELPPQYGSTTPPRGVHMSLGGTRANQTSPATGVLYSGAPPEPAEGETNTMLHNGERNHLNISHQGDDHMPHSGETINPVGGTNIIMVIMTTSLKLKMTI